MFFDYFAAVDAEGVVRRQLARQIPNDSAAMPSDEFTYYRIGVPIDWSTQPTSTSVLRWNDGALAWEETECIEHHRAAGINAIDSAGEALRMAVINRMTTQTEEYRRVEPQARAWRDAGYPESDEAPAPRGVRGWAAAKWREGWTNRQACDDILTTADSWYEILDTIRDLRLANKEDVRNAITAGEVAAIVADMEADMQALALQMNTTTTE